MNILSPQLLQQQSTVLSPFSFEGTGVHGGKPARVSVSPLPANTGLWFELKKSGQSHLFPALAIHVLPFYLATCIGKDTSMHIKTIEHLLSALYGLGVDNALISVVGDEIPIEDGSAWPFVKRLLDVGVHIYKEKKRWVNIGESNFFADRNCTIRFKPSQKKELRIVFQIDYPHPYILKQCFVFDLNPHDYVTEISKARTYGFLRDARLLHTKGLALGAGEENTIILTDKGIANSDPLRFEDEFVRHKILDALGDLALSGVYPQGTIEYVKSGHALNRQLAEWVMSCTQFKHTETFPESARQVSL